jgi:hypothetical protein
MQFTQRSVRPAIGTVIRQMGVDTQAKNFLTSSGDSAMQIKPPSAAQATAAPQPHKAAAGKSGDFAQLLKTAQADAPGVVPGAAATQAASTMSPTPAQARS